MPKMSIRGVSMNVEILGKGPPMALMHGGPGMDDQTMLPLEPLKDRYTLVFYDHRCNGRSDGIDVNSMTMDNLTADAEALRQALGFEKWAVLGHSFGGQVGLEVALRYPGSLSHLILMNTGGDQWWVNHNAPEILRKRGYSPKTVEAAQRFYNGEITRAEFLRINMMFNNAYSYRNNPLDTIKAILSGHTPKFQPDALIFGYSQTLMGWSVMDRLGEIHVPTMIVAGRYDFLFPTEHQVQLAAGLPNARLEVIENAGHNPHMEQQEAVVKLIREFLV